MCNKAKMQIEIHEFIGKWHMDPLLQFDKICFLSFFSLPSPAKGAIFGANWNPLFAQMTSLTQPGVFNYIWMFLGRSLCKNA